MDLAANEIYDILRKLLFKSLPDQAVIGDIAASYGRKLEEARGLSRDENVFEGADLQMAGYAAALRVLTRYAIIDGRAMTAEAIRPRVKGETTLLTDYVLVAQDRPVIDHYQHTPTGRWELETLEGLDVHLHLTSIGCTVPLADVYERIVFPQAEEAPTPRAREE